MLCLLEHDLKHPSVNYSGNILSPKVFIGTIKTVLILPCIGNRQISFLLASNEAFNAKVKLCGFS